MKKIILIALVAIMSSGCATTYEVQRTGADGCQTALTARSFREFPGGIDISYDREAGTFGLQAGEVKNDDQLAGVLLQLLPLIRTASPAIP